MGLRRHLRRATTRSLRAAGEGDLQLAFGLLCVYLAVMSNHNYSIDGQLMYRQALSIAHYGSLRFHEPLYWGADYLSSKYGIGLSLLYVPGVLLASLAGLATPPTQPGVYDWNLFYRDPVYAVGAAPIHLAVTALTAYLAARFVRELGYGTSTAHLAMIAYGVASPAIVYSKGDFAQPLLGLLFMVALLAALRFGRSGSMAALLITAAALCYGILTRPLEGSFLLPALLAMVWLGRGAGRPWLRCVLPMSVLLAAYVAAVLITLLVDWGRFGSPFQTGYSELTWTTPIWIGLPGALISPARGIIWAFPLAALAPVGLYRLWSSERRALALVLGGLAAVLLINMALWSPWWGGWSWGPRLFVPALPLVAVLAAVGAGSLAASVRSWVTAFLVAGGVIWSIPAVLTDLLGGYAGAYDGSRQSFSLAGYPPIGAWAYLHHLRAFDVGDAGGIDIVWFRVARETHDLSLLVPAALLLLAAGLALRTIRLSRPARSQPLAQPALPASQRRPG